MSEDLLPSALMQVSIFFVLSLSMDPPRPRRPDRHIVFVQRSGA
ncbi:MAG: hypothetical protein ACREHV_04895 [Rhizomicrobium sp.]